MATMIGCPLAGQNYLRSCPPQDWNLFAPESQVDVAHASHQKELVLHCMAQELECAAAQTVVNSSEFRLTTALLWIRNGNLIGNKQGLSHSQDGLTVQEPDRGLLPLHRDRLAAAAEAVGWQSVQSLNTSHDGLKLLRQHIEVHLQSLATLDSDHVERRKMRILVSKDGNIEVDSTTISISPIVGFSSPSFIPASLDFPETAGNVALVFIDTRPTTSSVFTTHKTTYRPQYNEARGRADITTALPTETEVLLYNDANEVMEGSLCTVYFHRNGGWITPAASCGGNLGVTRRLALENGLCREGLIKITDIHDGEKVWLSNGARGFFAGQVCPDHR